jgi:hypothetical protein
MLSEENCTASNEVELPIDPGRVCFGLSRIGYTPASALCDITDNSVQAEATHIKILTIKNREDLSDTRKNNVKEYLVIDDGKGMNDEGIKEALKLGASEQNYEQNSLSKFGLGLKSAAFSQGEELHLISSDGSGFNKYVVSLTKIRERGVYFATQVPLTETDQELIKNYLPSKKGTIVRITEIRMNNHPSVKMTVDELSKKLGVIYYYFMEDKGLEISINDQVITPFDVLCVEEADKNGNLDENEWDGKTVRWIEKPKDITLDTEFDVKARIEITQLPYPPIFELEEVGKQKRIREQYGIESGNYGFYVYRNKRLISWAESFGGIIPQDQDLYAFRGRILIDESADDSFNIDVKKSAINLSDEARNEISDRADEYKRKSRKAWRHANSLRKQILGLDPNSTSNIIAADFDPPDFLPGESLPTEQIERERNQRKKEIEDEMQSKLRQAALQDKSESEGRLVTEDELEETDIEATLKGESNPEASKIYRVESVEDNALWEPYYDSDKYCVRINKVHRFARLIFEDNSNNTDLQVILELLLLQLSTAEVYLQKNNTKYPREEIRRLISEYRRVTSEYLATMCRDLEGKLPPLGEL